MSRDTKEAIEGVVVGLTVLGVVIAIAIGAHGCHRHAAECVVSCAKSCVQDATCVLACREACPR